MARASRSIADYDAFIQPLLAARARRNGNQAGDPAKAAKAILELIDSPNPPTHLLLGPDALKFVREGLTTLEQEITEWEPVSRSTDFS